MSSKREIQEITDKNELQKIMEENSQIIGGASFRGEDIIAESRMDELFRAAAQRLAELNSGQTETSSRIRSSEEGNPTLESIEKSVTSFIGHAFMSDEERAAIAKREKEVKEKEAQKQEEQRLWRIKQAQDGHAESARQEQEILDEKDPVKRINLAVNYKKDRIISAEFQKKDGVTLKAYLDYIEQSPKFTTNRERYKAAIDVVYNNIEWYWNNKKLPQASLDVISRTVGRLEYLGSTSYKEKGIQTLLSVQDQSLLKPIDHTILAGHFAAQKDHKESSADYANELAMLEHLYQAAVSPNGTDPAVKEARGKLAQYLNINTDAQVREEKNNTLSPDIEAAYQEKRKGLQANYLVWQKAEADYEKAKITYANDFKLAEEKYEKSDNEYREKMYLYRNNAKKYNAAHEEVSQGVTYVRSEFTQPILQTISSMDKFVADKKLSLTDKQLPDDINALPLDALLTQCQATYSVDKLRNMVIEKLKLECAEIESLWAKVLQRSDHETYGNNRKVLHDKVQSLAKAIESSSKNPALKRGKSLKNFVSNPFVDNLSALAEQVYSLKSRISTRIPEKPYEGVQFSLVKPEEPPKPPKLKEPEFVPPKFVDGQVRVSALDEKQKHPSQNPSTAQVGVNRSGSFAQKGGAPTIPRSPNLNQANKSADQDTQNNKEYSNK